MPDQHNQDPAFSFGPFRLFPKSRLLEKDGTRVHIGGRALDILILLAERPGEVIDSRELVKRIWAEVHVDEGSLRFHIAALRKALGDTGKSNLPAAHRRASVVSHVICLRNGLCLHLLSIHPKYTA